MDNSENLYAEFCSMENLARAFRKARKRKTTKPYVIEFEKNLNENLTNLQTELFLHTYKPKPLKTFTIRDPKTRKISKSEFRDRVVHHALCNILEPIFEKIFICDSFANRKFKGVHKALERFDYFKRKVSSNNTKCCYVFKADIKHYFEEVNSDILIKIISKKIKDAQIIHLIKLILQNYESKEVGAGMPLGNLTSQFFANVYLNELDYFAKHELKIRHYIRYVDDFVILHRNKNILEIYKNKINGFLKLRLKLELHPDKCRIKQLTTGIDFLGFRVFYYHKLLKKRTLIKFRGTFSKLCVPCNNLLAKLDLEEFMAGWLGHIKYANTHKLQNKVLAEFHKTFKQANSI
ncbi:MAG: hypothetical protein HYT16_01020 [DPANN group archaeon]|nr:hypothetical protein [DPANN group archaeon]